MPAARRGSGSASFVGRCSLAGTRANPDTECRRKLAQLSCSYVTWVRDGAWLLEAAATFAADCGFRRLRAMDQSFPPKPLNLRYEALKPYM